MWGHLQGDIHNSMSIYYKKRNDIPRIPEFIAKECISIAIDNVNCHKPMDFWYRRVELDDANSLSYTTEQDIINDTGGVGIYLVPAFLNVGLCNYYKNFNIGISPMQFAIQVVTGGNFVAPHNDPKTRPAGLMYLLQSGGKNVRTKWYTVKDEYRNKTTKEYGVGFPYHKLDVVEDQCLEENTWHYMNFQEIHSVENIEYLRIAIFFLEKFQLPAPAPNKGPWFNG